MRGIRHRSELRSRAQRGPARGARRRRIRNREVPIQTTGRPPHTPSLPLPSVVVKKVGLSLKPDQKGSCNGALLIGGEGHRGGLLDVPPSSWPLASHSRRGGNIGSVCLRAFPGELNLSSVVFRKCGVRTGGLRDGPICMGRRVRGGGASQISQPLSRPRSRLAAQLRQSGFERCGGQIW